MIDAMLSAKAADAIDWAYEVVRVRRCAARDDSFMEELDAANLGRRALCASASTVRLAGDGPDDREVHYATTEGDYPHMRQIAIGGSVSNHGSNPHSSALVQAFPGSWRRLRALRRFCSRV